MNKAAEQSWQETLAEKEAAGFIDLRQYFRVLLKFKWGILSVGLLAGLIGLYAAYKAVPIYSSAATLQIKRDSGPTLGDLLVHSFPAEFYTTQYELIRSWSVAEIAAQRLGLLDADNLDAEPAKTGFTWRSLTPEFLRIEPPVLTHDIRRNDAIADIQGLIWVAPVPSSELARIIIEDKDPEWASEVANAVAQSYINFLRDKNLSAITGEQSWYSSRLDQARSDLEHAENALQDFLDRQGLIQTAEGVDVLQSQALQLALTQRDEAGQQKLALERTYRDIQAAGPGGSLETITALESRGVVQQMKNNFAQARQEVAQLSRRYGPRHPRMIQAQSMLESSHETYQEELQAAANAAVADYQRAVQTEASYSGRLNAAQADIQSLSRGRAELTKLQDDVKTSRALFEQLQSGEKTAGLLEGGTQSINATVIENARPGIYPVRPDKQLMVLMWVIGGLLAGFALALLLERLDNTFKGTEDVERRLELPVLGMMPQLKVAKGDQLSPMNHFLEQTTSDFSESIRTIRTGVMLSALDQEGSIIAVTSSLPGEGKTTLAINLAHSIAQMKKTLLIDSDLRRPMVHRAKKIAKPRAGLAALVTREATMEEAIEIQADGLHVIPSGTIPLNPLELLSSLQFKNLLKRLQQEYEVIIIDSAPALAVSDALVVSQLVHAIIYVIRADETPCQAAEQGIKRLRRANAPLLGVVLNQVIPGGRGYFGEYGMYGRYYRYAYTSHHDEPSHP